MKTIAWDCPSCNKLCCVPAQTGALICPHCSENCGKVDSPDFFPTACPRCTCSQFYLVKDFNQAFGCLIMLIGIVLVPRTYGLSLPAMALVDWFLFRRIPAVVICYRCGAEFRDFDIPKHIKPFIHQIGVKYDRKRK